MFFYALFVTCPPKKFIHLIVTCYLTPAVWTHFFWQNSFSPSLFMHESCFWQAINDFVQTRPNQEVTLARISFCPLTPSLIHESGFLKKTSRVCQTAADFLTCHREKTGRSQECVSGSDCFGNGQKPFTSRLSCGWHTTEIVIFSFFYALSFFCEMHLPTEWARLSSSTKRWCHNAQKEKASRKE